MPTRTQVVSKLREAAAEIQNLTEINSRLNEENQTLLQKIASYEKASETENIAKNENNEFALQKEANDAFSFRGNLGFGTASGQMPELKTDLSPERRLDLILGGESPSDFE